MGDKSAKVLLLGDGAVGKTSLVRRFVEQTFDDSYIMTIGVNVKKKELEDLDLTMMLWDIYGQKLNKKLHASNYSGADAAIIVYDLTRYSTFHSLDEWIDDVFSVTGEIPLVVLGNKFDLIEKYDEEENDISFNEYMSQKHGDVSEYYKRIYGNVPHFRKVPSKDLWDWAGEKSEELDMELPYYFTSAKTGENVHKAFKSLGELLVEG